MRTFLAAAATTLVLTTAVAGAQPAMTEPTIAPAETPAAPAPEVKNENTATAIAVGATLAGYALAFAGAESHSDNSALGWAASTLILVGPSAGHIYAGESKHALGGTLLRTGALTVAAIGAFTTFVAGGEDEPDHCAATGCTTHRSSSDAHDAGKAMLVLGGGAFVASTVYDLWDAHRAAGRANDRARAVIIAPTAMSVPSGMAAGLAISGHW